LTEFIAAEELERMKEDYFGWRAAGGTATESREYRFIDKQGNRKDISMTLVFIPETKQVVASLLDITERSWTKKALQTSEEKLRLLVEDADIAIGVIQDGRFKFINRKAKETFGYSLEELTSRSALEFVHTVDQEGFEGHLRALKDGGIPHTHSFRVVQKDGQVEWLESKMSLIHWEGKPAILNFMTDITARKQALEELGNSLEPFRAVVDAMEKVLSI
jgi:PAS domain S-box-containing protein